MWKILNNNCEFLQYITLNDKYDKGAHFFAILQLKSTIPIEWKKNNQMPKSIPSGNFGNIMKINNKFKTIEKVTWHLINTGSHTPMAVKRWSWYYPIFNETGTVFMICLFLKYLLHIYFSIQYKYD